jgi:hypothetical protein
LRREPAAGPAVARAPRRDIRALGGNVRLLGVAENGVSPSLLTLIALIRGLPRATEGALLRPMKVAVILGLILHVLPLILTTLA